MSDQAFRNAPPSENIEDRRDEFDEIQRFMISRGIWTPSDPNQAYRDQYGLKAGEWLDYDLANGLVPPLSPMGAELGGADLDRQNDFARLAAGVRKGR